eukprot:4928655-Amphidinium_carterae.1
MGGETKPPMKRHVVSQKQKTDDHFTAGVIEADCWLQQSLMPLLPFDKNGYQIQTFYSTQRFVCLLSCNELSSYQAKLPTAHEWLQPSGVLAMPPKALPALKQNKRGTTTPPGRNKWKKPRYFGTGDIESQGPRCRPPST